MTVSMKSVAISFLISWAVQLIHAAIHPYYLGYHVASIAYSAIVLALIWVEAYVSKKQ